MKPAYKIGLIILGAAAFLTVMLFNNYTFWDDEVNSFFVMEKPFPVMLDLMRHGIHEDPPLYVMLVSPIVRVVGRNVLLVRLPSVIFFLLSIPFFYLMLRSLCGEKPAFWSCLIYAFSPQNLLFAISARWYSLFLLLAVISFWAFFNLAKKPAMNLWFLIYIVSTALFCYTNYFALVFLGLQMVYFTYKNFKMLGNLLVGLAAAACIFLLYFPWMPTFLSQMGASPRTLTLNDNLINLGRVLFNLLFGETVYPSDLYVVMPMLAFVLGLIIFGGSGWRRSGIFIFFFIAGILIGLNKGVLGDAKRTTMFSFVFYPILGIILQKIQEQRKNMFYLLLGLLIFCWVIADSNILLKRHFTSLRWLDNWPQATAIVKEKSLSSDMIISAYTPSFCFYFGAASAEFDKKKNENQNLYCELKSAWNKLNYAHPARVWFLEGSKTTLNLVPRDKKLHDEILIYLEKRYVLKFYQEFSKDEISQFKKTLFPNLYISDMRMKIYLFEKIGERPKNTV